MKKIIISFLCFIMFLACEVPEYDFNEFYDADPPALVFQPFLKKVVAGSVNRVDIEALEINGTAGMYIKMEYDPDFVAIKEVVAGEFFASTNQPMAIVEDKGTYIEIYIVYLSDGISQSASGSGVVVEVAFESLKTGKSQLNISDQSKVVDANNEGLVMNTFGYFIIDAR